MPVDGPTALIVSDGEDHRRRCSTVAPGLRHRSVQDYVATMVSTIDNVIDSWRPGQPLDIYQEFRCAVRRSTTESLFGPRLASHLDYLGRQLQPLIDLTHRLPQVMQLQQRLNSPGWRRAMAARTRIDELIDAEIANARAEPSPDDRMLTALINGRSEEGCALSDTRFATPSFRSSRPATRPPAQRWRGPPTPCSRCPAPGRRRPARLPGCSAAPRPAPRPSALSPTSMALCTKRFGSTHREWSRRAG
ncbi:cytochrome P450 family protein [Mycobacterium ulcerans str. Harvey]|uniref:Cytochrome P450 family protein n=1 Tax=Mycobacterium ulcerans str. Harvey TaxID=1299332 RepID=A0ABP3AKZ2_MYCUL|nr:cytochrome P450 family protein [Mycobacterium ulcerans str. Harvey]